MLNNPLAHRIAKKILAYGPLSFRDFMELALYHPQHGYYAQSSEKVGRRGDFFTSASVGPLFGYTLARALETWCREADIAKPCLVEFGAGQGYLARDILEFYRDGSPRFFESISYGLVEISRAMRQHQEQLWADDPELAEKVFWTSEERLGKIDGVIFSNEFFDALPFHRVEWRGGKLLESFVLVHRQKFREQFREMQHRELIEYQKKYATPLSPHQRAEFCTDAATKIQQMARTLRRGFVVTMDYGDRAERLYTADHQNGTLKTFYRHRLGRSPLEHLGEQDITAEVNFSVLERAGSEAGLEPISFETQQSFLMRHDIAKVYEQIAATKKFSEQDLARFRRQIKNWILPSVMGERFKVLVQRKNG